VILCPVKKLSKLKDTWRKTTMQTSQSSTQTYTLGYTSKETQRLLTQGQLLNPFTKRMLEDAGITTGMKVLDLGCGPGDVSLLAADLVGETGQVLGVDANPAVLEVARARAQAAGLNNVSFQAGNINELALDQDYDAIVGRLILLYLPERVAVLRRLLAHLRPGGVVAFHEFDLDPQANNAYPSSALWDQYWPWITQAFERTGSELRMALKLPSTFVEVGLPAPQLRYEAAVGFGPESAVYEVLVEVTRSVLPLLVKFGIATAEEVDIDTLLERFRAENIAQPRVMRMPVTIAAWANKN
jgi:ubiquinone/menaquinone biosynthesis C-methylase UbiE